MDLSKPGLMTASSMLRVFLVAVLVAAAPSLRCQERKQLKLDDVLTLPKKLNGDYLAPIAWLDAQHYLAFGKAASKKGAPGSGDGVAEAGFLRVHATTGSVASFVDHTALAKSLAGLAGVSGKAARAIARDKSVFQWRSDHGAVLMNLANDLFHYDRATKKAVRLTFSPGTEVGEDFSPDGKMVAFIHDYNLHVVDVADRRVRPLTKGGHKDLLFGRLDWVYQEELYGRGNFKGFWWAPDSKSIAFLRLDESPVKEFTIVSDRPVRPKVEVENYPKAGDPNPKVDLAVVPVAGGDPRFFDLSRYGTTDVLISRVAWHPDSTEVYFQVQDRAQTWLDLVAGDATTGKVRLLFREKSDCWVEADANPMWFDHGQSFLWLSERDGFKHLYRYGRDGKLAERLTSGAYEVDELLGIDEPGGWIYVLADQGDSRQEHLWRRSLKGKKWQKITKEPGWHGADLSPDYRLFLDSSSSIGNKQTIVVRQTDGAEVRKVGSARMDLLAPYGLIPPELIKVKNRRGFEMDAMLIRPANMEAGRRYPVLCHIYSGPHAPRVRNRWGGVFYLWHQMLAQQGYLVWICDNESASGRGRKASKACYKNMGTTEMQDLEDSVKWLVKNNAADPERMGIWGWSYGGYQTSFCLTHSKVWNLGIAVNPVTDWRFYDSIYTERYMGLPSTNADGYKRASVIRAAGNLHGKLLLVHATMDDNVHLQNSLQFAWALQQAGKQFRFMAYPRVRHGIRDAKLRLHLFAMMTEFIEQNL